MNNPENQKEKTSIGTHPFYFGHYLNMARHNAYIILCALSKKYNFNIPNESEQNEAQLNQFRILNFAADKKKRPDELNAIKEDLQFHFPVLKTVQLSEFRKSFSNLLSLLGDLRNCYSHAYYKKDFKDEVELRDILKQARKDAIKRMSLVIPEEEFQHLVKAKESKSPFEFYLTERDQKTLTEKGVAFLCCLFLEKKFAFRFLSRLKNFHRTEEKWARATLETFTEYCCILPYDRLESSDIKLDMINELNRCPRELYYLLDDSLKKKFLDKPEAEENVTETSTDENAEYEKPTPLRRHSDRFPWFALNFFENVYPGIHFQVKLGRVLTQDLYDKTIASTSRDRRILKDINSFGHPFEYPVESVPGSWCNIKQASETGLVNTAMRAGEIDQYSPKFRITEKRIGLFLNKRYPIPFWPKLSKEAKRKKSGSIITTCKASAIKPDAILSTYELQNLFLYTYLYKKENRISKSPEQFILDFQRKFNCFLSDLSAGKLHPVSDQLLLKQPGRDTEDPDWKERKARLSDLLQPYGLKDSYLPDDIKNYLLGVADPELKKRVLAKMDIQIKTAEDYVEYVGKRLDKSTKDTVRVIPVGKMAQILARDIVFMLPHVDKVSKPNNQQYYVLQNMLAYFSLNKKELRDLFKELNLTQADRHPFLHKINLEKNKGILEFFGNYFELKNEYLNGLRIGLDSVNFKRFYKENKHLFDAEKKDVRKRNYSETHLLPRGLFNQAIAGALNADEKEGVDKWLSMLPKLGTVTQNYYTHKRYYLKNRSGEFKALNDTGNPYDLIGQINTLLQSKQEPEDYKRLRDLKKEILDTEKTIRYRQSTDRALWLMLHYMFTHDERTRETTTLNFELNKLQYIGYDNEEFSLFSDEYPFTYEIENKEHRRKLKVTETMHIRRYGDFRRFFKDRRLKDLILYFPEEEQTIDRGKLIKELDTYEEKREKLFEKFYQFEKLLNEKYGDQISAKIKGTAEYKDHTVYLDFIRQKPALSENVRFLNDRKFSELRNKILHNQIPVFEWVREEVLNGDTRKTHTERILDIIGDVYDTMIENIHKEETNS